MDGSSEKKEEKKKKKRPATLQSKGTSVEYFFCLRKVFFGNLYYYNFSFKIVSPFFWKKMFNIIYYIFTI